MDRHPQGRKPQGSELVEPLPGSAGAKARLRAILDTLAGARTIPQVCAELAIGPSRFHALRQEWLQQALASLEPKPIGRPAKVQTVEQVQLEELQAAVRQLQVERAADVVRLELAQILPHVGTGARAPEKKRRNRRPRRR